MKLHTIRNILLATVLVFAGVAQAQSLEAAQAGSATELSSTVSVPISFSALDPLQEMASPAKDPSGSVPGEGLIAQNGQASCPEGSYLVEVRYLDGSTRTECLQYQLDNLSSSLDAPISLNGSLQPLRTGAVGESLPREIGNIGESLLPIEVPEASQPIARPAQPPTDLVTAEIVPGL